jgi:hypothetical protein
LHGTEREECLPAPDAHLLSLFGGSATESFAKDWSQCAQPGRPMVAAETRKTPPQRGFSLIGAPRFELGTSSPPD